MNNIIYNIIIPILLIIIPTIISLYLYINNTNYASNITINKLAHWSEIKHAIDKLIININNTSYNIITADIQELKKKANTHSKTITFLQIAFIKMKEFPDWKNKYKDLDIYSEKLNKIEQINDYIYNYIYKIKHRDFLNDFASIIQIIFLPLVVLVGYYGMNFKSMGSPSLKKGVFADHYGQVFVTGIALLLVIIYSLIVSRYN